MVNKLDTIDNEYRNFRMEVIAGEDDFQVTLVHPPYLDSIIELTFLSSQNRIVLLLLTFLQFTGILDYKVNMPN